MISFVNTCKTCLPGSLLHQQFFRIRGEIRSYISAIKLCAIALPRSAVQVGYMGVATYLLMTPHYVSDAPQFELPIGTRLEAPVSKTIRGDPLQCRQPRPNSRSGRTRSA